jgi:hypothetical protein
MESGHQIETSNTAYFRHGYDCEHADMRRLYEQAKIDQWNAATDIDWAQPLEGDGGLIADDLVDIHGTKFWDRLSADQRVELNRYVTRWRLSTLMHGEHGAMLVCSQLVENVQGQDAKLFQATQVVDEGRHNEVLHRYLALRLGGESYPLAGNVREIFDTLLGTSAWYLKTIGLQLVAETFAVSLFRMLAESSKDEVLRVICRRILQDEARHMGFSMLSLPEVVEEATASERREMEDFAVWALNRTLRGIFPLAAYEDMGFDRSDIEEIRQLRRQRAAGGDETAFRKFFRRDLHAGLVRNMRKVGVLTNRVAPISKRSGSRSPPPDDLPRCRRVREGHRLEVAQVGVSSSRWARRRSQSGARRVSPSSSAHSRLDHSTSSSLPRTVCANPPNSAGCSPCSLPILSVTAG